MPAQNPIKSFSEELLKILPIFLRGIFKHQTDFLGQGKITIPQYIALDLLHSTGSLKMNEIARELNISLPAATGLIERLFSMNMIQRTHDTKDRRVIYITITTNGASVINQIRAQRKKVVEKLFRTLNGTERLQYLTILKKLVKTLYPVKNTEGIKA